MPLIRLYTDLPLSSGAILPCDEKRAHYLLQVMRLKAGSDVLVFNGKDGEWYASLEPTGKKLATLHVQRPSREQYTPPSLWLFATPLKNGRSEWVVEKATELGVTHIAFITTRYTNSHRINVGRLQSIAMEAAEQCERMDVPAIEPQMIEMHEYLERWTNRGVLYYGDESGGGTHPCNAIQNSRNNAILVGPEGGFSPKELSTLRELPFARAITLGPRILRADTAALAMITLVQSAAGDWEHKPAFRSEGNI